MKLALRSTLVMLFMMLPFAAGAAEEGAAEQKDEEAKYADTIKIFEQASSTTATAMRCSPPSARPGSSSVGRMAKGGSMPRVIMLATRR